MSSNHDNYRLYGKLSTEKFAVDSESNSIKLTAVSWLQPAWYQANRQCGLPMEVFHWNRFSAWWIRGEEDTLMAHYNRWVLWFCATLNCKHIELWRFESSWSRHFWALNEKQFRVKSKGHFFTRESLGSKNFAYEIRQLLEEIEFFWIQNILIL